MKTETVFKVGQKVFDYQFGWGYVVSDNYSILYPINVEFGEYTESYTFDGRRRVSMNPTLSFTEYTLEGFSQKTSIDYNEYIGKWGFFWNEESKVISKLHKYDRYLIHLFQSLEGESFKNFKPLTDEQVKILEL